MIHGDVSTQRGDSGDWSAATLNQPVMGGDKVSTGDNARAELQLDFANIFRLGGNSKANLATFTHKDIQIQLSQGIATYTVSKDSEVEPEIDTPNVSVHPAHHDGVFRIEVRPDGDTLVIVRKGEAQIATPQGSTEVRSGEMATIRGDSTSAQYKISQAPDADDWDRWNADRDHLIQNAQSWRHTNHRYTGAQDLDAYGQWSKVPDYGDVWVPNEPEGWVPYRDGNWVWETKLWLDMGRLRALGLGAAVSLRALVPVWQFVGLVARPGVCRLRPVLGAGVRVVLGMGRRLWLWLRLGRMGWFRLAPGRPMRLVPSVVGVWIPRTLWLGGTRLGGQRRSLGAALLLCTVGTGSRTFATFITITSCAPCRRWVQAASVQAE